MKLIAENKFTVTEELFREGMKRLIGLDYGPALKKILIFLVAVWAAVGAYILWRGGHLIPVLIETVALALVVLYLSVLLPRSRIKKGWKAMRERSDGEMERVTRFYEDRMEVLTTVDPLIVNYEDVTRTLETEHLMIIQNTGKLGVMIALDSFTLGTKEDVLRLIQEWSK